MFLVGGKIIGVNFCSSGKKFGIIFKISSIYLVRFIAFSDMIKMEFINKFDAEENLYLELVHQIRTMIVCFQALKHKGLSINYVIMTLSTPKRSVSNRKV